MKTKLITREGYNKLKAEHDYLWHEQSPEVTKIVTWAAGLGDRSENADLYKGSLKTYLKRQSIDINLHFNSINTGSSGKSIP